MVVVSVFLRRFEKPKRSLKFFQRSHKTQQCLAAQLPNYTKILLYGHLGIQMK